jgi:Flp pilus assembly protein TadG
MKILPIKQSKTFRAQAIVEFMLALPVLLMLLYGIIEVGRLIFIFSSVANASRQAARYGSASGEVDGVTFYEDCEGIRAVANQSAFIITFDDINITYDRGVNEDGSQIPIKGVNPDPSIDSCPIGVPVRNGDRIIVQVSTTYEPIITLLPIEPLEVVSASARSFLISIPIVGNSLPTGFSAETSTPSPSPTVITPTMSPTIEPTFTATFIPTSASIPNLPPVNTQPPALTFTPPNTALPTYTPSITATAISCSGLTGVSHGPLIIDNNMMQMSINNKTGHMLTVAQIYLEWNHDTGHISDTDRTLHLRQITLNRQVWDGDIQSPSAYIAAYYPHIPTGESMIQFSFHQNYDVVDGTERIIINISNPGCINYPVDSTH